MRWPGHAGRLWRLPGNKFFNLNFRNGAYGTANRAFTMTLEADYSISGVATVEVPTTIMKLFGFNEIPSRGDLRGSAQLHQHRCDDGARYHRIDATNQSSDIQTADRRSESLVVQTFTPSWKAARARHPHPLWLCALCGERQCWRAAARTTGWSTTGPTSRSEISLRPRRTWTNSIPPIGLRFRALTRVKSNLCRDLSTRSGSGGQPLGTAATPRRPETYTSSTIVLSDCHRTLGRTACGQQTTKHYPPDENGEYYWINLSGTTCEVY